MAIELKLAPEDGYEFTEEEHKIMAEHTRQTYDHINNRKIIVLPELYLSKEERQQVYDNCVGNVFKALDEDKQERTGGKNG